MMQKTQIKETDCPKFPQEFVRRMQEDLGTQAQAFFHSFDQERVYGLRYNPLKFTSNEEFQEKFSEFAQWNVSSVPWCKEGYYYDPKDQPGKHPWHEAGAYYIQEPSAMSAVELLGAKPGEKICDLCAAPGGKTTQIAGKMQGQGLLVSNEYDSKRAKILSQNVERMGIGNCVVLNEETERLAHCFEAFFDRILVDAPCSGEGMFRKDPKAALEWSLENVALCVKRQREILDHAAKMLKPNGVMVYATCTFSLQENEQCIEWFLQTHPEFSLERAPFADRYFCSGAGELPGTYRLWPHRLRGEGHFAARLVKSGGAGAEIMENMAATDRKIVEEAGFSRAQKAGAKGVRSRKSQKDVKIKEAFAFYQEFEKQNLRISMEQRHFGRPILFSDQLYLLPQEMPKLDGLRVVRPGLHLGVCKKDRFEPSHALALYLQAEDAKMRIACQEPLKYLHGETISCSSGEKGWALVCFGGIPLGWGKAQNGMVKNHYPKGLRICY